MNTIFIKKYFFVILILTSLFFGNIICYNLNSRMLKPMTNSIFVGLLFYSFIKTKKI